MTNSKSQLLITIHGLQNPDRVSSMSWSQLHQLSKCLVLNVSACNEQETGTISHSYTEKGIL